MNPAKILPIAQAIILDANQEDRMVGIGKSFLDYAQLTLDIINEWPTDRIAAAEPWLKDFLFTMRQMRDDFARMVERDPPILYKPINPMAHAFHRSHARYRYVHSGNRCSKTQAGAQEVYWFLTDAHPWRTMPPQPTSAVIIGTDYTNYGKQTFEPKWVAGEPGTILSPMVPEGGKWFHSYNRNDKVLTLGCAECAENDRSGSCPHPKPKLYLVSDRGKPQALAGSQHGIIHEDEQIEIAHHQEAEKRIESVPNACLIATETPVRGRSHWTYEKFVQAAQLENNKFFNPATKVWVPNISVHTCSQFEGNVVPHEIIESWMIGKTREEVDLRVYGKHVAIGAHHVFDLPEINDKLDYAKKPWRGDLKLKGETLTNIRELLREMDEFPGIMGKKEEDGAYRIWKKPRGGEQYLISVDVAQGLSKKDYSVAHVYHLRASGARLNLRHVAKLKGWINPTPYAHMVHKLALYYNNALVVVERNGPGHTLIYEMSEETYYNNLYRPEQNISAADPHMDRLYGISTTGESKPVMMSMAQQMLKDRKTGKSRLTTWDAEFLRELESYIQVESGSGRHIAYQGEGIANDDEVIAYALAAFVVKTDPNVYDWERNEETEETTYDHLPARDREFWESLKEEVERGPRESGTLVDS